MRALLLALLVGCSDTVPWEDARDHIAHAFCARCMPGSDACVGDVVASLTPEGRVPQDVDADRLDRCLSAIEDLPSCDGYDLSACGGLSR